MLLEGKKILIMGIRNKWSIAFGIAKSAYENGAQLLFTYMGEENKEKIEELMNIYQEYIDKENRKEKKRYRIILTIFSAFAGVLTISFDNMGVIGIDFISWLYVAIILLVFIAAAGIWIYSYTFFDTLKRKYELMIKDLKDLLLLKY